MTKQASHCEGSSEPIYFLKKAVLGKTPKIEISSDEYNKIVHAQKSVGVVLDIEEAWDEIIQNYVELELEILSAATRYMVSGLSSNEEFSQTRSQISRRVSNLLHSCRAYLDHTGHHLSALDASGELKAALKVLASKAYDAHFGYRFMEALRNYAQHKGVPMHGLTLSSKWLSEGDDIKNRGQHTAAGRVNLTKLRESGDFKKSVLAELPPEKKYLDIIALTREYMEGLSTVHNGLREQLKASQESWTRTIRDTIERYAGVNDGNVHGLVAIKSTDGVGIDQQLDIFDEPISQIERFQRRNRNLVNLRKRYATSQILSPE